MDIRSISVVLDPFTWGKIVAVLEEAEYEGIADAVADQVTIYFDKEPI